MTETDSVTAAEKVPASDAGAAAAELATPRRPGLPWLYVIGGLIGLVAATALSIEKFEQLKDPGYIPTCSINPVLSCGSVMNTAQAAVFGFPNPFIGIGAFAAVAAAGAALLAGLRAPRWYWLGLQLGTTLGVVFVHWLIYQSLYEIGALCPYCMVVWTVTIPMFWYTTLYNLEHGHLPTPRGWRGGVLAIGRFHSVVLTLWYLAVIVLVLIRFWYYWSTLL